DDDLAVAHHGPGRDTTDAQNRDLGVVHDRSLEEAGKLAGARDGERRAAHLLGGERPRAGSFREVRDLRAELGDGLRLGSTHDRADEAFVRLYGYPDVVAVEVQDGVTVEPGIELGKVGERVGGCLHDGGQEIVEGNALEVALLHPGDRRDLAMRARHVL